MQNVYDLVDLGLLNARLREVTFPDLILDRWLPNTTVDRTRFRYVVNDNSQQPAASFMAWDAESPIGGRPGASVREGALPPIKEKRVLTESDQLLAEDLADGVSDEFAASIFDDTLLSLRAILQRLELAKGEALSRGRITINERRLNLPVNFGVPAAHMDVAPAVLWTSTGTSSVLTNLTTWRDVYVANTGRRPGVSLTSSRNATLMQRSAEVVAAIAGTASGRSRVTRAELNDLLISEDLPPVSTYDAQYRNAAGSMQRAIDEDRFLFLPEDGDDFGETQIGRTREAAQIEGARQVDLGDAGGVAGIVAVTMQSFDPPELWSKVAAVALPVVENPALIFSADVA